MSKKNRYILLSVILLIIISALVVTVLTRINNKPTPSHNNLTQSSIPSPLSTELSSNPPPSPLNDQKSSVSVLSKEALIQQSVVMRIGSPNVYVLGKSVVLDPKNSKTTPRFIACDIPGNVEEINNIIFVPLKSMTQAMGIHDLNVTPTPDGSDVINQDGIIYMSIEKFAQVVNKSVYYAGEIIALTNSPLSSCFEYSEYFRKLYSVSTHPVLIGNEVMEPSKLQSGINSRGVIYKAFYRGQTLGEFTAKRHFTVIVQGGGEYIEPDNAPNSENYIGIGFCNFNPYPVKVDYSAANTNSINNIVKKVLTRKGLSVNDMKIKDVMTVDVDVDGDGDGTLEQIIVADNEESTQNRFYSLVMLNKPVNNTNNIYILKSYISKQAGEADDSLMNLEKYHILDVLDVDGNQKMEAVLSTTYVEGRSFSILSITDLTVFEKLQN